MIESRRAQYKDTYQKRLLSWRKEPWRRFRFYCLNRCGHYTWYKNIKLLMEDDDFKYLWFRDKAWLLKNPSIDRIDSKGNYELSNCQFIENHDNVMKARVDWSNSRKGLTCSVCESPFNTKGLCHKHYLRQWRKRRKQI